MIFLYPHSHSLLALRSYPSLGRGDGLILLDILFILYFIPIGHDVFLHLCYVIAVNRRPQVELVTEGLSTEVCPQDTGIDTSIICLAQACGLGLGFTALFVCFTKHVSL